MTKIMIPGIQKPFRLGNCLLKVVRGANRTRRPIMLLKLTLVYDFMSDMGPHMTKIMIPGIQKPFRLGNCLLKVVRRANRTRRQIMLLKLTLVYDFMCDIGPHMTKIMIPGIQKPFRLGSCLLKVARGANRTRRPIMLLKLTLVYDFMCDMGPHMTKIM